MIEANFDSGEVFVLELLNRQFTREALNFCEDLSHDFWPKMVVRQMLLVKKNELAILLN